MLVRWAMLRTAGVAYGLVLSIAAQAQELTKTDPFPRPTPAAKTHSLEECLTIALRQQPTILAARHSLRATELGFQALNNLRPITERLSPDIPFRKQQSQRGIHVGIAAIMKAEQECIYDVTYLYFSYVYAYQQELTAIDVLEQMDVYYKSAEEIVKSGVGGKKINNFTLYSLQMLMGEIKALRLKAETYRKRSLEALKEAMAVDSAYDFTPRDTELPVMSGTVTKDQVIEWALSRRPELIQAAAAVDVFRLEICAQDQISYRQQVPTFAAGSDLHSKVVPQAVRNGEYKPGAIPPEMPTTLVGRREDRVARATALAQQQDEVYRKIVNLVRLESINTFLEYEAATTRLNEAKRKFEISKQQAENARTAAVARQDAELLVNNEALAGKAQAEYVEAAYEHLKALAKLQRVTAGGVSPNFAAGVPTSTMLKQFEESPKPESGK